MRLERSCEGKAKHHLKVLTSQTEALSYTFVYVINVFRGVFPLLAPVSDVVCLYRTRRVAIQQFLA